MTDLSKSTSQWIKFFEDAGLPANIAANYAIIFSDNRIQFDMLTYLSKEYLYDMGIKVMGDVISILKHAKEYHIECMKEKMVTPMGPSLPRNSTPASRILERLTKPSASYVKSRLLRSRKSSVPQTFQGTHGKRLSVFDRLGDKAVNNTVDVEKHMVSPIFNRLGSNSDVSSVSLSSGKVSPLSSQPLQYMGVLKKTTGNSQGKGKPICQRLGAKNAKSLLKKKPRSSSSTFVSKFGVHERKSVFERLGKRC